MATLPKSELPNQDLIRKPNKNCKICKADGAKTKTGTPVIQEQQLADDSVSLDLQRNLISQISETFTYVEKINEGNRQIMNKLDHFQNNAFSEHDLPKQSEEITDCKLQEKDEVQYPMKTHKHSECTRAIETADKLSRTLDAFCKCFEEQICLERRPTSASQSDSVKWYPMSVVFRSGLRRKHICGKDDNSVALFLSGGINQDRKSPCVVQAPNFSNIIRISRSKSLKADKLQHYPGCSTPTTTTILTSATTNETHSANTSTIQMTATSLTTNATTAEITRTITITGNPEGATSQPCPSAGNITGRLRRNQTNIKDDNRLVSYEAQIERRTYKPLVKSTNDGELHVGGRQNSLNGLNEIKGTGHQFVQGKERAVMREHMIPEENRDSDQGPPNPSSNSLGSDQIRVSIEQIETRDVNICKNTNARESVSVEDVGEGQKYSKRHESVTKQSTSQMDTQGRVRSSEIPKEHEGMEDKISNLGMKQTNTNSTESALARTRRYNSQEGDNMKMDNEDSMAASELSSAQGKFRDTLYTIEPSINNNGDKSVSHSAELLKTESVATGTLLALKPPIKQRITRNKNSTSGVPKKHNDDTTSKSTSKLLTKHVDSKGMVPTSCLSGNIPHDEDTTVAMELSKTHVATGDGVPSSQRLKENQAGTIKSNSLIKPTKGILKNSKHRKSAKEPRRRHQVTVKNPTEIALQDKEETTQGLDLMPFVQQVWQMVSGDSNIGVQLDTTGMKMELLNPGNNDPNQSLVFKYKLEEFGIDQTVELNMNELLSMQAQAGLDGSQPFQLPKLVDLNYWPKFCNEEVQKGRRYRIDDDSIDTVLCIDISSSMKGEAWGQAMDFARNFVRGIKANPPINVSVQEKIALVTFGHMTQIHKHLTTDYDGILRLIDHLYPDGPSPMEPGLLLCMAAIEACGKTLQMQSLTVFPRIIMITDGIPTASIMLKGPDINFVERMDQTSIELVISAWKVDLDFQLFCVPVGDSRTEFLKKISKCTGGKVIKAGDWKKLVRWSRNLSVASRYIDRFQESEGTLTLDQLQKENNHLSSRELREIWKLLEENEKLSTAADSNQGQVDIPVGTRVRRGPDWNKGDEDGCGPGTVVEKCSAGNGQLKVVWDESKSGRNVHIYRFSQDIMEIIPVNEPRILSPGENIAVGCCVERGRDWQHENQDGGPGNIGVVTYFDTQAEIVHVTWPNGGSFTYRFGDNGISEIRVRAQPRNIYEIPANAAERISGSDEQLVDQRNQQNKSAETLMSDRTSKQSHTQTKRRNKNQ
ncbi:hypothetical protein ACJMK2_043620 [Sinanodonta woodiana]|uniref:MIB/HERC2 domain-containing protein n=1 Tax=Sinanodonta woodiana TaxID=1069815 RepID=A0ABD3VZ88_SINWO